MDEIKTNNSEGSFKQQFTTVTPLSKYLAVFFFIMLPVIGFFLGVAYKAQTTVNNLVTAPQSFIATPDDSQTLTTEERTDEQYLDELVLSIPGKFSYLFTDPADVVFNWQDSENGKFSSNQTIIMGRGIELKTKYHPDSSGPFVTASLASDKLLILIMSRLGFEKVIFYNPNNPTKEDKSILGFKNTETGVNCVRIIGDATSPALDYKISCGTNNVTKVISGSGVVKSHNQEDPDLGAYVELESLENGETIFVLHKPFKNGEPLDCKNEILSKYLVGDTVTYKGALINKWDNTIVETTLISTCSSSDFYLNVLSNNPENSTRKAKNFSPEQVVSELFYNYQTFLTKPEPTIFNLPIDAKNSNITMTIEGTEVHISDSLVTPAAGSIDMAFMLDEHISSFFNTRNFTQITFYLSSTNIEDKSMIGFKNEEQGIVCIRMIFDASSPSLGYQVACGYAD